MADEFDPEYEESESSVERVKKQLYTRGSESHVHARRVLHDEKNEEVAHGWHAGDEQGGTDRRVIEDPNELLATMDQGIAAGEDPASALAHYGEKEEVPEEEGRSLTHRFITTLFIASATFFVLSAGVATWWFMVGKGQVSCENIELSVRGPISVASGKELVLYVGVTNRNPVPLRNAEIVVEFPEGTRSTENTTIYLTNQREQVGSLEVGESVRTDARALLFGREGAKYEITSGIHFGIDDSNATWHCETPHTIAIATAPVSIAVDALEEISSGQELVLNVSVTSNSEQLVPDVRLTADYPFGFTFLSADPKPTSGDAVWDIGDLSVGDRRDITIRGLVTGTGIESRSVRFAAGEIDTRDPLALNTTLQTMEHPYLITSPFIVLDLTLNGQDGPEVNAQLGREINGRITYRNNTNYPLHNVEIETVLPSVIVERRSVAVEKGFFRSQDNTMIWTPQTQPELTTIEPGGRGTLTFKFDTLTFGDVSNALDPRIDLAFDVRAQRVSDDRPVQQDLVAQAPHTIRFISDTTFTSTALFGVGPFSNTGIHPPKVEAETTYTVVLTLANTTNDVNETTVVGRLPLNVTWLDRVVPEGEAMVYNPVNRQVTWRVGTLESSTGYEEPKRQVSFQVALVPSISQLGTSPNLLENIVMRGVDDFTGAVIEQTNQDVTTRLRNDPYFPNDFGRVRD